MNPLLFFTCIGLSMGPSWQGARITVDTSVPLSSIRAGELVSFRDPRPLCGVTTHRVIEVHPGWLWTRGDANALLDSVRVNQHNYIGLVIQFHENTQLRSDAATATTRPQRR